MLPPNSSGQLPLGNVTVTVPLCPLPDQSGYFLYFKLNDYPTLVEEAARLIAKRISTLNLANPYFVTPEASTLALAHVLRHKYHIPGIVLYKNIQLNDVDPIGICYYAVTSLAQKTLYLSKNKVKEMQDKNIIILDSICTLGGTLRGIYLLLVKAGILPANIVEAVTLFTEGVERTEIVISPKTTLKLYGFNHLPVIKNS